MAILLNKAPNNITEYPHSLKRQGAFPLEYYSVFQTLAAAEDYAQNNLVAYVGQPIAVTEETTSYYVIINTKGDLMKLGDSNLDINEVDRRLKEIEEFFALEEGESLKDTLDELIELQKWIQEHLGDFDDFKEEVRKNLETEIRERTLEDKKLSEAIGDEQTRAVAAEENLRLSIAQNTNAIDNEQVLREEADASLSVIINTEKTTRQAQFSELQNALSEEVARATNREAQISQDLNNAIVQTNNTIDARCALESTERIAAINKLQSDVMTLIDAEAESRGTSDELLQIKIDEEITTREEEVENLRAALFDETNTARAAESELNRRLAGEEKTRMNEDLAIMVALNNEKQERQEEDARLAGLIEEETERANKADSELYKALAEETERANKADDELYQAIEDLTEEDIHLKTDLYTYVNIGKITGASDTSRKKVANKGDSLKTVFNAILGTRKDKQPTITNNASLTATDSKTYGGGEYGTAVAEVKETITFTLSNTGTANYGYRVGETEHKGSQTFYYPIVKQEEADIKITLPENKTAIVLTEKALVKTVGNILYCNLTNKQVQIQITLPADTVETSEQTRYDSISAVVSLGTPEDAEGNTIASFLTYLESEGETAQVTPPSPEDKKGGDKTDSTGAYKINKGSKYVYWAATDDTTEPVSWTRYGSGQTGITDLQLSCNAGQYLWVAAVDNKTSLYAWNDASGKYNTDKLPTTKSSNKTITNKQAVEASGYYFYRTTDPMKANVNTKFKLA